VSGTTSSSTTRVLGIAALSDLLFGTVLSVIGVSQDLQVFSIVGVVLMLSGGAMLTWVAWARNRPETL
jgi:arginine exporter protein ArgO